MTTSATTLPPTEVAALRDRLTGRVLARGDLPDGGPTAAEAVAAHSTLVTHDPDLAVLAATESDVVEAVRFASHHGLRVRAHATGHGASSPVTDGLVLGTSELAGVEVDPETRIAHIAAGTRWKAVVEAGAEHGLLPVTGSSTGVGRGRTVLALRFAYPGDAAEGERLAAPLRALAPVLADAVGEIPTTAVATIHSDPEDSGPSWVYGAGLRAVDGDFLDRFLAELGPAP